jgi:hypothetical protein
MSLAITDDVTIEDIDEALKHIYKMLKTDEYGNRMDWRKKNYYKRALMIYLMRAYHLRKERKVFD